MSSWGIGLHLFATLPNSVQVPLVVTEQVASASQEPAHAQAQIIRVFKRSAPIIHIVKHVGVQSTRYGGQRGQRGEAPGWHVANRQRKGPWSETPLRGIHPGRRGVDRANYRGGLSLVSGDWGTRCHASEDLFTETSLLHEHSGLALLVMGAKADGWRSVLPLPKPGSFLSNHLDFVSLLPETSSFLSPTMAPALFSTLRRVVSATPVSVATRTTDGFGSPDGPLAEAHKLLAARAERHTPTVDPDSGVLDPHDINNVGFFVLFALIGVAIVVTGIWFFFWARNGGFVYKENDWDDYKTTVLRRRGPNGTLLSGATASTNLGGGSVYKDVNDHDHDDDDGTTVVTESTALSGITAGASDIGAREKRRAKQDKRDREREKKKKRDADKKKAKSKSDSDRESKKAGKRTVGENGVLDEEAEQAAKNELRSYRHERAARVGGINKEAEGSNWDGSTNPTESMATESTAASELLPNRQTTPTTTPTKPPGIRKVYSTAERAERAEARRLRQESRTSRRDFSYQQAENSLSESLLEGSSTTGTGSEVGTKSYHHPLPELREMERERERGERRTRRGGYRRGRGVSKSLIFTDPWMSLKSLSKIAFNGLVSAAFIVEHYKSACLKPAADEFQGYRLPCLVQREAPSIGKGRIVPKETPVAQGWMDAGRQDGLAETRFIHFVRKILELGLMFWLVESGSGASKLEPTTRVALVGPSPSVALPPSPSPILDLNSSIPPANPTSRLTSSTPSTSPARYPPTRAISRPPPAIDPPDPNVSLAAVTPSA
ncbi:hypothetical protein G7046_g4315 [Stylonectria norvegica]|nr:hypothetical protein G7046_g4315 [Stylonectria norvegica]